MNRNLYIILFISIIVVAFFLRFYKLGQVPYGFYQDESAIGYNAYSLLQTGRDEYGKSLPIYFKSFGDYKLPVYIYASIPSILLFGMTEFAIRFPSALFGFLTVIVMYFFIKQLTNDKNLALLGMAFLAVNPWHLHYNRATFEVSISLFLFTLGGWLLLKSFSKKTSGAFLLGTLCFIVSLYSYNLTRLLAPGLFLLFLLFHKRNIHTVSKNEKILTVGLSFFILLPFLFTFLEKGGVSSAQGTLIFSSARVQAPLNELRAYMLPLPPLFGKVFFNTFMLTAWQYCINIASYLSVGSFFIYGSEHGNHGIGNVGQFYLIELPFLITGIYLIFKEKLRFGYFLLTWVGAVIAVASLTREAPHMTRSFFMIVPLLIISALGVKTTFFHCMKLKNKTVGFIMISVIFILAFYNIVYYFTSYYVRFPILYAKSWRSADKEVSLFIKEHGKDYEKVIFDPAAGFMYSSLLFYIKYSPEDFQTTVVRAPDDSEGFSTVKSFGKYEFRDIDWTKDIQREKVLIITRPERKPDNVPPLKAFYYPMRPVSFAVGQNIVSYPIEDIAYVAVETK